jgi:hypothetical protein
LPNLYLPDTHAIQPDSSLIGRLLRTFMRKQFPHAQNSAASGRLRLAKVQRESFDTGTFHLQ